MKKIVITHSIYSVVSSFLNLFLATYFLRITKGNILSVVLYYTFRYSVTWIFSFITLKLINKDNVLKLYRIGLCSNGLLLLLLLLLGNKVSKYIFIYAILDAFTSLLYWSPYKMILYNFKNDSQLKSIFSYSSMVTGLISIISTIGMGYVIVNSSYATLLIIISVLVGIGVLITFTFDKYNFNINKLDIKNLKYALKDKQAKQIYEVVFYEGMGFRGGLNTTITLIIFLSLGSESSLGNLNALFAFLGLCTAFLVKKFLKEKDNKRAFIISVLAIIIGTIPIIFTDSLKMFILYNIVFNIAYKITQILVDTAVFNINSNSIIKKYQLEYTFIQESIHGFGKLVSEIILLLVVILSFKLSNLRIVAAILSFSIVLQMFAYKRYCKYMKNNYLADNDK